MDAVSQTRVSEFSSIVQDEVDQLGLTLTLSTDFTAYRKYRDTQTKRSKISPIFDPAVSLLTDQNALWISCTNKEGEIVHSQAVRCFDLSTTCLSDYIADNMSFFGPEGFENDENVKVFSASAAGQMSGLITYHGEAWIHPSVRSLKMGSLSVVLGRFGLTMAVQQWPLDFCFAFMSSASVLRGLSARAGFFHMEPTWYELNQSQKYFEWFMWMSRLDVEQMTRVPISALQTR